MIASIQNKLGFKPGAYPSQFWLMFWGMLVSTIGSSMVWPFLVVYVSGKLQLPLTTVASLITLSSTCGLISSLLGGPVIDRLGRKWVMVVSLLLNGCGYLLMSQAASFPAFALIMALNGTVNPLYRVAADAMMADLIPADAAPGGLFAAAHGQQPGNLGRPGSGWVSGGGVLFDHFLAGSRRPGGFQPGGGVVCP